MRTDLKQKIWAKEVAKMEVEQLIRPLRQELASITKKIHDYRRDLAVLEKNIRHFEASTVGG